MKGVPIKFRGTTVKYKEVVYGYLFHCGDKAFIMSLVFYTAGEWEMQTDEVDPDSVAQLVGYDANGEEVYEGDTIDVLADADPSFKYTFKAVLTHNVKVSELMAYCLKLIKRGNTNE